MKIFNYFATLALLLFMSCSESGSDINGDGNDDGGVELPSDDSNISSSIGQVGATYDTIYKVADGESLHLTVMVPDGLEDGERVPAVIFFHGGAFATGSREAFDDHSYYFCSRGMVAINIEYRVGTDDKMIDALNDAKTAMRFSRANAEKYHIDVDRIASSGGSAGGCLAAAITLSDDYLTDTTYDEGAGISEYSCKSNAMMLLNPVLCNGDGTDGITSEKQTAYTGWGYSSLSGSLGDAWRDYSPMHNITGNNPPPVVYMIGDSDDLIPEEQAWEFKRLIEAEGQRCDTYVYEDCEHGFFNLSGNDATYFYHTLIAMDKFLVDIGYLSGEQNVAEWVASEYPKYFYEESVSYKTSNE